MSSPEASDRIKRSVDGSDSDSESSDEESVRSDDLDAAPPQRRAQTETQADRRSSALPKFAPPAGMVPVTVTSEFAASVFEFDKMSQRPDMELWAIRVPTNIKPSKLSGLAVSKDLKGSIKVKSQSYTLVSAGNPRKANTVVDSEGREPRAGPRLADAMAMDVDKAESSQLRLEGGEEMLGGMRLLVPRVKAGGKLFVAPLPVSRHLLLTPETLSQPTHTSVPLPSYLSETAPRSTVSISNDPSATLPPGRQQPTHLLKFRNRAYGFDTPGPGAAEPAVDHDQPRPAKKKKKATA